MYESGDDGQYNNKTRGPSGRALDWRYASQGKEYRRRPRFSVTLSRDASFA